MHGGSRNSSNGSVGWAACVLSDGVGVAAWAAAARGGGQQMGRAGRVRVFVQVVHRVVWQSWGRQAAYVGSEASKEAKRA